jgi:heptosyltransferase-1
LAIDLKQADFRRILLIKPSALGDVVHTVPVLVKLRRRFPEAGIDWLLTPENAELVRAHPDLSHVLLFDRRAYKSDRLRAVRETVSLVASLRRAQYELVIDLHGQLRSALFTLATGAPLRVGFDRPVKRTRQASEGRPPLRHGWAGAREFSWLAYNRRLPIATLEVHALERYLWLGDLLGFDDGPPETTLHLPIEAETRARRIRAALPLGGRRFAIVAPGTMWETKHWRIEGFADVVRRMEEHGLAVALVGTEKENALCSQIRRSCPKALDLSGQTTPAELAALLREASVCLTNDSGAMHLAVAMGTPVVTIFGPTDPVQVGPYGHPESVVRAELPCSPCNLRRVAQCPYGLACMKMVSGDDVWARVKRVLEAQEGRGVHELHE